MKRFAGIAAAAFIAHSGWALAQPVIVGPPDEAPRGRAERPSPGEAGPQRGPSRSERDMPQQRQDGPASAQRGMERDDMRSPGQRLEQPRQRDRDQGQRERLGQPSDPRPQEPQRGQLQQQQRDREQAQRERPDERSGRRDVEPTRPDTRQPAPQTPQTAQPQRPDGQAGAPSTAQPGAAPGQDQGQRPGSAAQRSDPAQPQPGATGAPPSGSQPTASRQSAEGERAETEKQRIADTVRDRVERNEIRPSENLGVTASVGAQLPSRVQLQPLPSDIVSIRPQYRDYRYTVSDREIVIVDPRSRRVVEVIERDGSRRADVDVYAVFEQRRDVRRWRRPNTVVFERGIVLPPDAPYYDLPVEVVERNPRWRGHQYVMTERDEVAIVEPRTHRIVEVVDKAAARSSAAAPAATGSTTRQPAASTDADSRHAIARIILSDARPGEIQGVEGLRGAVLSQEVVLRPVPTEAAEQDQQLRGYHYALIGDDVLIVDPQSRQIIDVIE